MSKTLPPVVSPVAYLRDRGWVVERIAGTFDEFDMIPASDRDGGSRYHVGKAAIIQAAKRMGWVQRPSIPPADSLPALPLPRSGSRLPAE